MTPHPTPAHLAAVALGGACGAGLRFSLEELAGAGGVLPWPILAINVSGSFLLALLTGLAVVRARPALLTGLGPGLLGGFTTMSAVSETTRSLLDAGDPALAAAYVLLTLVGALGAVALARRLVGSPR